MKTPPALRPAALWLCLVLLVTALTVPASASEEIADDSSSPAAVASQASPEATAGEIGIQSLSQCGSGYFCVWTQANFTGTIQRFSSVGYATINVYRVGSFYNNRNRRVYLYANAAGNPNACFAAGAKRGNTSSWPTYAAGAYLSSVTSC